MPEIFFENQSDNKIFYKALWIIIKVFIFLIQDVHWDLYSRNSIKYERRKKWRVKFKEKNKLKNYVE